MVTQFTLILIRYHGCQGSQIVKKAENQLAPEEDKLSERNKFTNQRAKQPRVHAAIPSAQACWISRHS
jgi:hypothetical protein